MRKLHDFLQNIKADRVLDVAARHGEFARKLKAGLARCGEIQAVDLDGTTVAEAAAKNKIDGLTFKVMDAAHLKYENAFFDLAAVSNSLHHIDDIEAVLREMLRVLKPGGRLIINEMYCDNQTPPQTTHVALHHLEGLIDTFHGECHKPTLTRSRIVEIFDSLNLTEVKVFDDIETDPELKRKLEAKIAKVSAEVEELRDQPVYEEVSGLFERGKELFSRHGIERCTQLVAAGRKR